MHESPRYVDALNAALGDELERDGRVIVLGVDVAAGGGVYGVTRGLHARFPRPASWARPWARLYAGSARSSR
jgi:pyruvate/2-oxoglutarate/acetoin dehydrogenase E1 component